MISLASVPAGHPYVHAVVDPEHVALHPDPIPPSASEPDQWWPPRWLEPNYLIGKIREIDVLHLHFGFDSTPPEVLRQVVEVTRAHGVPLVLTVHDLHNPHFADPADHLARLDVLIPAASALVTLTGTAAQAITARWGRVPLVLPHPHVLPLEEVGRPRPRRATPVVGLHAKALRANIDPLPVLDVLLGVDRPSWCLRLDCDENMTASPRAEVLSAARVSNLRARGIDVRVHPRFTDAELAHYLTEVDILVLPYRFGTHSGWVEACYDAGVCAVVPDCGAFADQHDFPVYHLGRNGPDAQSLSAAVHTAVRRVGAVDAQDHSRRGERAEEARIVRREMTALYHRLRAEADAA